jgi:hypothetical protein
LARDYLIWKTGNQEGNEQADARRQGTPPPCLAMFECRRQLGAGLPSGRQVHRSEGDRETASRNSVRMPYSHKKTKTHKNDFFVIFVVHLGRGERFVREKVASRGIPLAARIPDAAAGAKVVGCGVSHFGVRAASGIPHDAAFISFVTHSAPRNGVKLQNVHVIR